VSHQSFVIESAGLFGKAVAKGFEELQSELSNFGATEDLELFLAQYEEGRPSTGRHHEGLTLEVEERYGRADF